MAVRNVAPKFLNQSKFARHRNVSRKTVTDWKSKGLLVFNEAGQVDVTASEARLNSRPPNYRGGVTTPVINPNAGNNDVAPADRAPDPADFGFDAPNLPTADAIRRKENFLGLLRRHEYRIARRDYVRLADVTKHIASAFTGLRRQLQQMPARHVADMAATLGCDPAALHGELDRMIAETLTEMSAPTIRA